MTLPIRRGDELGVAHADSRKRGPDSLHMTYRLRERRGVVGRNKRSMDAITHDGAAVSRGDYVTSRGESFEDHARRTFYQRGKYEDLGAGHALGEFGSRQGAEKSDARIGEDSLVSPGDAEVDRTGNFHSPGEVVEHRQRGQ